MSHVITKRLSVLSNHGALVVVVCECGDKFKSRSTHDAERDQFQHMLKKERDDEVPF